MSDDQNTTQNQDSEKNSIPPSPEEPTADMPINTTGSEPVNMPSEPLESPRNADIPVSLNNDNPENTPISTENPEVAKPAESGSLEVENPKIEPISEPIKASEPSTAQIPVNEPLVKISLARELLIKARNMIQSRKRKKLDKVMTMFAKQTKITNDEVEKFLHVSDATAERYLNILEKENQIKQTGKTGHSVFYIKI